MKCSPVVAASWSLVFVVFACGGGPATFQPGSPTRERKPTSSLPTPPPELRPTNAAPKSTRIPITKDMPPALRDYIASADRECAAGVEYACRYNVKSYFEIADQECEQGKPRACHGLAEMYRKGDSIDANPIRAVELHEKGCAQRDIDSCFRLARMLDEGDGVSTDDARAAQLYQQACEAGVAPACPMLGAMYATGEGVTPDVPKSVHYFQLGCDAKVAPSCGHLGLILISGGRGVPKDPSRAAPLLQLGCEDRDARDERRRLAGRFCFRLGDLYAKGQGVNKDRSRARALMTRACDFGWTEACPDVPQP